MCRLQWQPASTVSQATETQINYAFRSAEQGDLNDAILNRQRDTVVDLSRFADYNLRYFTAIEDGPRGYRWFVGRGCHNCHSLRHDPDYVPGIDWLATFAVKPSWGQSGEDDHVQEIVHDFSMGHNLAVVREDGGHMIGLGGQLYGKLYNSHIVGPGYTSDKELRDGIRILRADSFQDVLNGAWLHPPHDDSTKFASRSFTSTEDKRCCFDSVVSLVFHRGRWLVFSRVNMKYWGGRYVQVAQSDNEEVRSGYSRSTSIDIAGYDKLGDGNIYCGEITKHPLDSDMLLGMFPVNAGIPGHANGNGDTYIGMAFSCDGFSWSELVHLVKSKGKEGRAYDMPVNGVFLQGGVVTFYVHRDVEHIAPTYATTARIEEFTFRMDVFAALTRRVKESEICRS